MARVDPSDAFESEADLVAAFCAEVERLNGLEHRQGPRFTIYHETAGWDLLLVEKTHGYQLGIEAKMALTAKALDQSLPSRHSHQSGPDYRAILVPYGCVQNHIGRLAAHVGITVIRYGRRVGLSLPNERDDFIWSDWHSWCPAKRCELPDYIPDVSGGKSAPVMLTPWKVKAIKLLILLERRGFVTRADMNFLQISPTRWTCRFSGFLTPGSGGYVSHYRTPDLKAQNPKNWAEIEADFDRWKPANFVADQLIMFQGDR